MSTSPAAATAISIICLKRIIRGRLFLVILIATGLLVLGSVWFVQFVEQYSMVQELAVSTTLLGAMIIALVGGSNSVRAEREEQTIDTVLSKPIGSQAFLVSSYMGIVASIAIYIVLSGVFVYTAVFLKAQEFNPPKSVRVTHVACSLLLAGISTWIAAAISISLSTLCKGTTNLFLTILILGCLYAGPSIIPGLDDRAAVVPLRALDCVAVLADEAEPTASYLAAATLYGVLIICATLSLGAWIIHQQEPSRT